jgi:hypothetical protein
LLNCVRVSSVASLVVIIHHMISQGTLRWAAGRFIVAVSGTA